MFVSIQIDRWFRAVFRGLIDDYKEDKEMNIDDIILLLKKIEDIEEFTVKLNLESCGATLLNIKKGGKHTKGVACANTGRSYIGIEMDDKYFDIGVQRLKEVYDGHIKIS